MLKHLAIAVIGLMATLCPLQAIASSEIALSEIGSGEEPSQQDDTTREIPLPDPLITPRKSGTSTSEGEGWDNDTGSEAIHGEVIHDLSKLPEPVLRMRRLIVEAAASGELEQLRPLTNPGPRQVQVNGDISDPIEALQSFSGDPEGQEILAILLDILSTGAVHLDAGTPEEVYVWPYFAGTPLSSLTPPERVELLRIVTAGDLLGMEEGDNYSFYRLAITPDGEWKSFTGGD